MTDKKVLTKEDIFNAPDLPTEEVFIKEWGGSVFVRGMNASERDDFEAQMFIGEGKDRKLNFKNLRARLVALTLVDEDGKNLFTLDEVEKLGKKNSRALDKLFAVAQRLSGIGQTDVEDLIKNSSSGQSD